MPDPLTREPTEFTAGDTVKWKVAFADFPANDGWTLKYTFRGPEIHDVTATADGADHSVTLSAAVSADFTAGDYWWDAYASKAAERYKVRTGQLKVLANLEAVTGVYDGRSIVKRTLDALEAMIEGKASRDQMSYSIEGRSLSRMSVQDVLQWRGVYRGLYRQELDAERRRLGKPGLNLVRAKFTRP